MMSVSLQNLIYEIMDKIFYPIRECVTSEIKLLVNILPNKLLVPSKEATTIPKVIQK